MKICTRDLSLKSTEVTREYEPYSQLHMELKIQNDDFKTSQSSLIKLRSRAFAYKTNSYISNVPGYDSSRRVHL